MVSSTVSLLLTSFYFHTPSWCCGREADKNRQNSNIRNCDCLFLLAQFPLKLLICYWRQQKWIIWDPSCRVLIQDTPWGVVTVNIYPEGKFQRKTTYTRNYNHSLIPVCAYSVTGLPNYGSTLSFTSSIKIEFQTKTRQLEIAPNHVTSSSLFPVYALVWNILP